MRPIDYIKKYNLEQDSKFSHEEFVSDLVIDFLTLLEVGNGQSNFKGFFNAVNAIRGRFDSIVRRSNNRVTEELWKYFYATTICKLRDELFPKEMEKQRQAVNEKKKMYEQRIAWEREDFNFWEEMKSRMFFNAFIFGLLNRRVPDNSWFSILGISPTSNKDEILDAYRRLAKVYHPDKGGNGEMFIKITEAKNRCLSYC